MYALTCNARLTNFRMKPEIRKPPEERPAARAQIPQRDQAADPATDKECTRSRPLRVRKTVQKRHIDLLATDSDRQNWCSRHTSGEVRHRQRCYCSSILVSPRKDVGMVTAKYTGY